MHDARAEHDAACASSTGRRGTWGGSRWAVGSGTGLGGGAQLGHWAPGRSAKLVKQPGRAQCTTAGAATGSSCLVAVAGASAQEVATEGAGSSIKCAGLLMFRETLMVASSRCATTCWRPSCSPETCSWTSTLPVVVMVPVDGLLDRAAAADTGATAEALMLVFGATPALEMVQVSGSEEELPIVKDL
jgi:hypothetical protein